MRYSIVEARLKMNAWCQVTARIGVRHIGDKERAADPPEVGHKEHHDDGVEGIADDVRPVPRESHDQHHSGECEAGKARKDFDVELGRLVELPWVATELRRAAAGREQHHDQAESRREQETQNCPHLRKSLRCVVAANRWLSLSHRAAHRNDAPQVSLYAQ